MSNSNNTSSKGYNPHAHPSIRLRIQRLNLPTILNFLTGWTGDDICPCTEIAQGQQAALPQFKQAFSPFRCRLSQQRLRLLAGGELC
mmetsp:Transcript_46193/g.75115  ORF Transcript_46193/g.75115 Transcript_46193/m.75115 type:complete len:87 (-) Transcript_46193:3-263(-)